MSRRNDSSVTGFFMDSYRKGNNIAVWIKTGDDDIRLLFPYSTLIYIKKCDTARKYLDCKRLYYFEAEMKDAFGKIVSVFAVKVPNLSQYERFVSMIERDNKYKLVLYNADIKPEESFLFYHGIKPFSLISIEGDRIIQTGDESAVPLTRMSLRIISDSDIHNNRDARIIRIEAKCGEKRRFFEGGERNLLLEFSEYFNREDADMIIAQYAFSIIPFLYRRLLHHNIICSLHRFDDTIIGFKGSRSFYTYGSVIYREFGISLHGRFLLDESSFAGSQVDIESLIELCSISGIPFSRLGSKSFGSIFQGSLVRELMNDDILVPFKEKPVDNPMTLFELLKSDRSGLTLDPKVGFHTNVAEIDFSSMYPWLIYNNNISAEMIKNNSEGKMAGSIKAPGIPVESSILKKGYTPRAIKAYLDKRMYYKRNPSAVNRQKALGLKWVLVTSYGYLRFREFKLGMASSHMAIGAFARDLLIRTMHFCEDKDYEIIHGIVDALYISKNKIDNNSVRKLCSDIESFSGIPVSFEGIFRWVVFMPSINDSLRPVPTKYYGVFDNGEIKVRGIMMRQKSTPGIVKYFQGKIIEAMSKCSSRREILSLRDSFYSFLRSTIRNLRKTDVKWLECRLKLGKEEYKNNIAQKQVMVQLRQNNVRIMPGQSVNILHTIKNNKKSVCASSFYSSEEIDFEFYSKLLVKSLFELLQPLGVERNEVERKSRRVMQSLITDYCNNNINAPAASKLRAVRKVLS